MAVRVEQLATVPPFERLAHAHLALVAATAREVTFEAGNTVFAEGQLASGCWLMRSGKIALESGVPGLGQVVVQMLGPGDVLGWSWLIPPHHWHFTATAATRVMAIEFDTERMRALADADPALGYPLALGLIEVVAARLQATRSRLIELYGNPRGH